MTFDCIDSLAFGDIPYENSVVETRTQQNIFRSWMPFQDGYTAPARQKKKKNKVLIIVQKNIKALMFVGRCHSFWLIMPYPSDKQK